MRTYAVVLGLFAFAFAARVAGQLLVAVFGVTWLPPMAQWYSGLMPYAVLLPTQIMMLLVQVEVSRQLWVGRGPATRRRPRAGRWLLWFSLAYFLVMLARYVLTRLWHPEWGWTGGTIPIVFHWVLAGYVYIYSRYLRQVDAVRE